MWRLAASRDKPVTVCVFASIFRACPPLADFEFNFAGAYGVFLAALPGPVRCMRMCLCRGVPLIPQCGADAAHFLLKLDTIYSVRFFIKNTIFYDEY